MPAALELVLHDVAELSRARAQREKKLTFCPIFQDFLGPKNTLEAI
jgi:hypothetical protein